MRFSCHLEHITLPVSIGRTYTAGRTFENRDPFESSFLLKWFDRGRVELGAVDKPLTIDEMRAIKRAVMEHGIAEVLIERHGRLFPRRYPTIEPTQPTHPLLMESE